MTEHLAIEANGARLDEQRFRGRQGRIPFAYLAVQKGRPAPRDELAELLWGEELPATWEKALRVLMTKLRALLEECGLDGSNVLQSAFRRGLDEARVQASTAAALARRSFLPGEDGS